MDRVICVSEEQARRACARPGRRCRRWRIIRNAIFTDRFGEPDEPGRAFLQSFFGKPRSHLIGAAGRFSPGKGFGDLASAAADVVRVFPDAGFLLFGDGPLHRVLARRIAGLHLEDNFALAGFRADLDRWLPNFDAFVLPSYTEGLPNVVLEASAARVPVIATAVGGTPECSITIKEAFSSPPAIRPNSLAASPNCSATSGCARRSAWGIRPRPRSFHLRLASPAIPASVPRVA